MDAKNDLNLFGFFNDASDTPAYDPGLSVVCLYCRITLSRPLKTISLAVPGDSKSYFYRVHKNCYEQMELNGETEHYEGILIDNIFNENSSL